MDPHYLFLLASVLLACISQLLLKKGAMQRYPSLFREYCNPWVIGGYLLLFGSMFLSIQGLRTLDYLNASRWDTCWCRYLAQSFLRKSLRFPD